MKQIIRVLVIYTIIAFAICFGVSAFYGHLPVLLDNAAGSYKFFRGLKWFLNILPALLVSSFLTGGSIQWKNGTDDSEQKFSKAMGKRFKYVIIFAIVISCVLTLSQDLLIPAVNKKITKHEENPVLLKKALYLGNEALKNDEPLLAWQYAEQANAIYPHSDEVASFYKRAVDARDLSTANVRKNPVEVKRVEAPIENKNKSYKIREMVEKAEDCIEKRDWFNAHYWATLAVNACNGTNTNLQVAQDIANTAWNELSNPVRSLDDEINAFHARKKEGYTALIRGDSLQAYYIFHELSSSAEHFHDPDIVQYLAIAKERVESNYFFIDETADLEKFEDKKEIYFTLKHTDGSYDLVYIDGVANVKGVDGMIRYLDGLSVITYSKYGSFISSMHVPFAKMSEVSVDLFTEEQFNLLGISKNVKTVPYILLQSVDRETEGLVCKPEYSYRPSELPAGVAVKLVDILPYTMQLNSRSSAEDSALEEINSSYREETASLILPMKFSDFDMLASVSEGAENMSMFKLIKFIKNAKEYGYSHEVYLQSLISRCIYPLCILILIVIMASFAWNYRLDEDKLFKTKWLLVFPLITAVIYVLLKILAYIITLVDFFFISCSAMYAFPVEFAFFVLVLIIVSINFLSRSSK